MRTKRVVIANLIAERGEGYDVLSNDSIGFFIKKDYLSEGVIPKSGDIVELLLEDGCEIVGIRLNETTLFHKSEEEVAKERRKAIEAQERKDKEWFEKHRDELDREILRLPELLQHRVLMFQMFDPKFRWKEESYELSAMKAGYKMYIAGTENVNTIEESAFLSGNQVSFAISFARAINADIKKMNIFEPSYENLRDSKVMHLPNALSPLCGVRCIPRSEYIDEYIKRSRTKA